MKMPSRLYPPHYLLLSILSIVGIDSLLQVPFVSSTIALVGGLLFLLSGIVLAASAARLFPRQKPVSFPLANQQNWSLAVPTGLPEIRCI